MIRRLLNTTAFRLSGIYACLFSLIVCIALAIIYGIAETQITQQTDRRLRLESDLLQNRTHIGPVNDLLDAIGQEHDNPRHHNNDFYFYIVVQRSQLDLFSQFEVDYQSSDGLRWYGTQMLDELLNQSSDRFPNRPARILITQLSNQYLLLLATDMSEQEQLLNLLYRSIIIAILLIFTLALLGGAWMGYSVLKRVEGVRNTAGNIIEGDLSQRMSVTSRGDEFDRLSLVLNDMLSRLEHLMQAMREVTDNLAHDLRTPLNRLRQRLDSYRFESGDTNHFKNLSQEALEEVDGLIQTFNALLSIAQTESGVTQSGWETFDLSELCSDLHDLYEVMAEEKGLTITAKLTPSLEIHANRQLLAQAITNVLDNGIKYTPESGQLTLSTGKTASGVSFTVCDTGPGIPTDQHENVFKRFARLDSARTSPGNGLGLSLVKAVIDIHKGKIKLSDNEPGLCMEVQLPASSLSTQQ